MLKNSLIWLTLGSEKVDAIPEKVDSRADDGWRKKHRLFFSKRRFLLLIIGGFRKFRGAIREFRGAFRAERGVLALIFGALLHDFRRWSKRNEGKRMAE